MTKTHLLFDIIVDEKKHNLFLQTTWWS